MTKHGIAAGKNGAAGGVNKSPPWDPKSGERRLQRLLAEHDLLKKFIATHLYIHIKEEFGFPPEKYHLVFRVDGLLQAGKSIEPKSDHIVEILLPDDYPDSPPVCSMLSRVFHPNISDERIDIKEEWNPETTVADMAVKIGQMIVFQRYSVNAPLNREAAQWAVNNSKLLPLSAVNFARTAEAPAPAAGTAGPARPKQAAAAQEPGEAETIVLGDAAAPPVTGAELREDDTAQLALDTIASIAASEQKTEAREARPVQAAGLPVRTAAPQPGAPAAQRPAAPHAAPAAKPAAPVAPVLQPRQKQLDLGFETPRVSFIERIIAGFKIDSVFCVRCGKMHDAETVFCTRCGAMLYKRDPKRIAKTALAVGAAVAVFLAAEVGGLLVLINL